MAIATNPARKTGIDFAKTFGQSTGFTDQTKKELPKADIWINIGYETDDPEYPFVSLPVGIPLDTMEELPIRGRNETFNAFTAARNDFMKQLQEAAKSMKPGEDSIIGLEGGLAIQVRRVSSAPEAPAVENNKFARQFNFAGVSAPE